MEHIRHDVRLIGDVAEAQRFFRPDPATLVRGPAFGMTSLMRSRQGTKPHPPVSA